MRSFLQGLPCAIGLSVVVLGEGCILEDNPAFAGATDGGTGSTSGSATESGPATESSTAGSTAGATGDTGTDDGGTDTGGDNPSPGCSEVDCLEIHVGIEQGQCGHDTENGFTAQCDLVGKYGLRVALGMSELEGGARIILHDADGGVASYPGGIEVPGNTTIATPPDTAPDRVRIYHTGSTRGVLRIKGDGVHFDKFTIVCTSGCGTAFTVRTDWEAPGSETGAHLFERIVAVATGPADVGINAIERPFHSLGPDTTLRNCHFWGYFGGSVDLRFAQRSSIVHNTFAWYQTASGNDKVFDADGVDFLTISHNVLLNPAHPIAVAVSGSTTTEGLSVVGNHAEGFSDITGGVDPSGNGVDISQNVVGAIELESPHTPLFLADSMQTAAADASVAGTSLDGVSLSGATQRLPGAYQQRSNLSLPRRTVIRVGEGDCGGSPCDVSQGADNELQAAAFAAWPGSVIELYPTLAPYSAAAIISWPVTVRGMGAQPDDVVLRRDIESSFLTSWGFYDDVSATVVFTGGMSEASILENVTLELSSNVSGVSHEGGSTLDGSSHELRRIRIVDDGMVSEDLAGLGFWVSSNVIVHDALVQGGMHSCVRFGVRYSPGADTPETTAWVNNLTCRLTELHSDGYVVAAFEVASVSNAIIANAAVELPSTQSTLFRAQRQSSGDADPVADDVPQSFVARSILGRGWETLYDGFDDSHGSYNLVDVDELLPADPLFVSAADSHLDDLAIGIDGGVDPSTLNPPLPVGVALDGIDRNGRTPDRGCYEQGL